MLQSVVSGLLRVNIASVAVFVSSDQREAIFLSKGRDASELGVDVVRELFTAVGELPPPHPPAEALLSLLLVAVSLAYCLVSHFAVESSLSLCLFS